MVHCTRSIDISIPIDFRLLYNFSTEMRCTRTQVFIPESSSPNSKSNLKRCSYPLQFKAIYSHQYSEN